MKYIKVTNKTGDVNRLKLEKLGFSTKREDEETIGQFGSGIKFAPIAAIRKGINFVFAGNDMKGSYTLEYIIKEEDGINSIFYKYKDYEKPSSFTAEAGSLSWESDFQIYREVVANAMDESKLSGEPWSIDIVEVDEINPVDREFSVYFLATESMLDIYNNHDSYFSNNRVPIYSGYDFSLYEPIDENIRVYCKNVLVYSGEENDSMDELTCLFDYEFKNLKLNEERKVSSLWDMHYEIIRALSSINDEELIHHIFDNLLSKQGNTYYELNAISTTLLSHSFTTSDTWLRVFDDLYKKTIIISSAESSFNMRKTITSKGYNYLYIRNDNMYKFLSSRNIPIFSKIIGEGFKYDFTTDLSSYPKISKAIEMIEVVYQDIDFTNILGVYEDMDENEESDALGITVPFVENDGEKYTMILINKNHARESDIKSLISTLIHEWDHYSSGIGDGDFEGRMFRALADDRIGELVFKLAESKVLVSS